MTFLYIFIAVTYEFLFSPEIALQILPLYFCRKVKKLLRKAVLLLYLCSSLDIQLEN